MPAEEPPTTPLVEEHPDPLLEFVEELTVPQPDRKIDAADLLKAFRGWCSEQDRPSPPASAAYARLRLAGFVVTRGAQNRQWLHHRSIHPHLLPEYVRLQGVADSPHPPDQALVATLIERDLRLDAAQFGRERLARLLQKSIDTIEETLTDADPRIRQSAALAVLRSFVPQAKAREQEDPAIDVASPTNRPSIAEIVALVKKHEGEPAAESVLAGVSVSHAGQPSSSSSAAAGVSVPDQPSVNPDTVDSSEFSANQVD